MNKILKHVLIAGTFLVGLHIGYSYQEYRRIPVQKNLTQEEKSFLNSGMFIKVLEDNKYSKINYNIESDKKESDLLIDGVSESGEKERILAIRNMKTKETIVYLKKELEPTLDNVLEEMEKYDKANIVREKLFNEYDSSNNLIVKKRPDFLEYLIKDTKYLIESLMPKKEKEYKIKPIEIKELEDSIVI